MVIHQAATAPGVVFKCELLGALRIKQIDPDGPEVRNDRYIFCPRKEDAPDKPVAADKVTKELRRQIEQFFLSSALGTGKKIKFKGWQSAKEAANSLKAGMSAFRHRSGR
jgi:inorganic pyrophosphatase